MKRKNTTSPEFLQTKLSTTPSAQHLFSKFIAVTFLAVFLYSCDDEGTVGSSFTSDDAQVNAKTVEIPSTDEVSAPTFSANENYVSAGQYDDMLFGSQKVTALFQPSLSPENLDSVNAEEATAHLELKVDELYGDVDASTEFTLYQITRRWRGSAWRPDSVAQVNTISPLGTATYNQAEAEDDRIIIPVETFWVEEFAAYFNDQNPEEYRENLFGFALMSEDAEKIVSFDVEESRFVVNNHTGDEEDDGYTDFRNVGYSLEAERTDEHASDESSLIYSTFENFMKLNFEITDEFIGTDNISRAELVLYKDTDLLDQTIESNHRRNTADLLDVYLLGEEDLELAIADEPRFQASFDEDKGAFRINMTSYIREQLLEDSPDPRRFYVIVGGHYGKLLNTALFNHNSEEYSPRLLITSVDPD